MSARTQPHAPFLASFSLPAAPRAPQPPANRKVDCGWYDSSFDLTRGLEIVEDDDDALYQLWALARH
jgi:hypothetical protein